MATTHLATIHCLLYLGLATMVWSQTPTLKMTDEPMITAMGMTTKIDQTTEQAAPWSSHVASTEAGSISTQKVTEAMTSTQAGPISTQAMSSTIEYFEGTFNYSFAVGLENDETGNHELLWRGKLIRNLTITGGEIGAVVNWTTTNSKAFVIPDRVPNSYLITDETVFPHDVFVVIGGRYPGSGELIVMYTPPNGFTMEIGGEDIACIVGGGRLNTVATYVFIIWLIISYVTMGCKMNINVIKSKLKPPTGVIIGMICQFIVMPPLAYGIATMFRLQRELAVGLILVGTCPGGWISNVLTVLFDCDFVLSLTMTAFSTVIAMFMMPLNLYIYVDNVLGVTKNLETPYVELVVQLLLLVIPLGVGVGLAYKWPKLEDKAEKLMKPFATILVLIAVGIGIPTQIYIFFVEANGWITSLLLPCFGAFFGLAFARILAQPYRASTTIAFETACQNALLAKTMANLFYPKPESDLIGILPLLVAVLTAVEGLFAALVYTIVRKCRERYKERHADAEDNVALQGVTKPQIEQKPKGTDGSEEKQNGVSNPAYS